MFCWVFIGLKLEPNPDMGSWSLGGWALFVSWWGPKYSWLWLLRIVRSSSCLLDLKNWRFLSRFIAVSLISRIPRSKDVSGLFARSGTDSGSPWFLTFRRSGAFWPINPRPGDSPARSSSPHQAGYIRGSSLPPLFYLRSKMTDSLCDYLNTFYLLCITWFGLWGGSLDVEMVPACCRSGCDGFLAWAPFISLVSFPGPLRRCDWRWFGTLDDLWIWFLSIALFLKEFLKFWRACEIWEGWTPFDCVPDPVYLGYYPCLLVASCFWACDFKDRSVVIGAAPPLDF